MPKVCYYVGEARESLNNRVLTEDPEPYSDNLHHAGHLLRLFLAESGVELGTNDLVPPDEAEIVFFVDAQKSLPPKKGRLFYLFLIESLAVRPDNAQAAEWDKYDKVFTWSPGLADGKKFIRIYYSLKLEPFPTLPFEKKSGFACMVCRNKGSTHPQELYTARRQVIAFYENQHPTELHLFGQGWDGVEVKGRGRLARWLRTKHRLSALLHGVVRRIGWEAAFFQKTYRTYQGTLENKIPVLARYKFCYCYENIRDIPGYVTEKILHAFLAGTVPVYWGASDVTASIPPECFIDRRDYPSEEALFEDLLTVDSVRYSRHQRAITAFLARPDNPYSSRHLAETMGREILKDLASPRKEAGCSH